MKGFGTVVTGTLISGTIRKEDELEVFPIGKRVRVRGVQVHGAAAEQAIAGQRTALNLAGVTTRRAGARHDAGAAAILSSPTRALDVSLSLLPSAKPLERPRPRALPRLHDGDDRRSTPARAKQMSPGETAFAQLRLAEPTLLLPGDRFIMRQFSPVVTIGGGVVLDAAPMPEDEDEACSGIPDSAGA